MAATLNTEGVVTLSAREFRAMVELWANIGLWLRGLRGTPFDWMSESVLKDIQARCRQLREAVATKTLVVVFDNGRELSLDQLTQGSQRRINDTALSILRETAHERARRNRPKAALPTLDEALNFRELFADSRPMLEA